MRSILLVHPDADRWLESRSDPSLEVMTAASAAEARAYLAGTAFDAVWIGPDVEAAERVGALRDALGLDVEVETLEAGDIRRRLAGERPEPPTGPSAGVLALKGVRDELGRIAHDLNNPLAVISGNAQLATEMARAVPTDETIVEAIANVQEAADDLGALFAQVAALRARIDRVLG